MVPVPSALPEGWSALPARVVTAPVAMTIFRMVRAVGDVEVARSVGGDAGGLGEARRGAGAVGGARLAGASERGDGPGRDDDLPDGGGVAIGDVKVARPVAGRAGRQAEAGGGSGAVDVALVPRRAGKRGHGAGRTTTFRMVLL